MSRNLRVIVHESEAEEAISPEDVREIEEVLADLLFEAWRAERGAAPATSQLTRVAA